MSDIDKKIVEILGWEEWYDPEETFGEWELLGPAYKKDGELVGYGEKTYSPSTNIKQAMELLEGLNWTLTTDETLTDHPYHCQIITGWDSLDRENEGPWGGGHVPAEAICKAYLKWKNSRHQK